MGVARKQAKIISPETFALPHLVYWLLFLTYLQTVMAVLDKNETFQ